MRARPYVPWLWLLPAGALLIPFFVLPLLAILRNSVYRDDPTRFLVPDLTLANYVKVLSDPYYLGVFADTIGIALVVAAAALVLAYPFALVIARAAARSRALLFWVVYLPLYVSVIMRVFGWLVITADSGLINEILLGLHLTNRPLRILYEVEGMTLGILHRYLPFMILPLVNTLQKIDGAVLKASASLGAGSWLTWRRVILPLSLPGAVAGTQLVVAGVLSDYVLPLLMGATSFPMVAPTIYYEAATNAAWALSGAMASVLLAIVGLFLVGANLALRRFAPWASTL
jgi:putative spermidine/putrescine transport system permease protein